MTNHGVFIGTCDLVLTVCVVTLAADGFYRAMLAQSAVMRLLSSVRLSVRLSVRP